MGAGKSKEETGPKQRKKLMEYGENIVEYVKNKNNESDSDYDDEEDSVVDRVKDISVSASVSELN